MIANINKQCDGRRYPCLIVKDHDKDCSDWPGPKPKFPLTHPPPATTGTFDWLKGGHLCRGIVQVALILLVENGHFHRINVVRHIREAIKKLRTK